MHPPVPVSRLSPALTGAVAGFSFWVLAEGLRQGWLAERAVLGLAALAIAFFAMLLALSGSVGWRRTAHGAALPAAVLAAALWWAGGRHERPGPFLELGYGPTAFGMALLIVTPLLGGYLWRGRDGWRDYPLLFTLGWQIVVRFVAAGFFTGLFWGLMSLSDALLGIVGVRLLDILTRHEAVIWVLSGAVFGLGLAAVDELSDVLSPDLLLRLLRLFLPLVLVVSTVFLLLLPLRGWDGLLTGFSPAAILIAFAVAAIVLVTVALDRNGAAAVQGRAMRAAVQAMAVLVPVLAGLAVWAVWLRAEQYGWTPSRLVAATLAAVALLYGLAHAGSVIGRGDWMARIRAANIRLALASTLLCLAWLTVVHPERLSAQSQIARALSGLPADEIPLEALARNWGHAGRAALDGLEAARPDLSEAIAAAREGGAPPPLLTAEALAERLPVYPDAQVLQATAFDDIPPFLLSDIGTSCANALSEGPGCALFVGRFDPADPRPTALLFLRRDFGSVDVLTLALEQGRLVLQGQAGLFGALPGGRSVDDAALAALHRGQGVLEPSARRVLKLGAVEIFPQN